MRYRKRIEFPARRRRRTITNREIRIVFLRLVLLPRENVGRSNIFTFHQPNFLEHTNKIELVGER